MGGCMDGQTDRQTERDNNRSTSTRLSEIKVTWVISCYKYLYIDQCTYKLSDGEF